MRSLPLLSLLILALTAKAAPSPQAAAQKIDAILQADWKKAGLQGNPEADDNTFVRRIYLDIIGRIPTTREVETFLNSKEADKRARLIDRLLGSEGYVQHMYNYWADVLRVTSNGNQTGVITGAAYMNFVKESLRSNKPYDQFVRDMVAAQGKAWEGGAISSALCQLSVDTHTKTVKPAARDNPFVLLFSHAPSNAPRRLFIQ